MWSRKIWSTSAACVNATRPCSISAGSMLRIHPSQRVSDIEIFTPQNCWRTGVRTPRSLYTVRLEMSWTPLSPISSYNDTTCCSHLRNLQDQPILVHWTPLQIQAILRRRGLQKALSWAKESSPGNAHFRNQMLTYLARKHRTKCHNGDNILLIVDGLYWKPAKQN